MLQTFSKPIIGLVIDVVEFQRNGNCLSDSVKVTGGRLSSADIDRQTWLDRKHGAIAIENVR